MALSFGVVTYAAANLTALGTVQEVKVAKTSEVYETRDETGHIAAEHYYREKHTLTCTLELDALAVVPVPGTTTLSVDSVTYTVQECEVVEKNDAKMTLSITATYDVPT